MSRKSVEKGMFTLHPIGIPHGPHPGTVEKSIGKEGTEELAVMIDTFRPLKLTKQAMEMENPDYYKSWKVD
jgi:homogentisate 1,2-dioxygenase